MRRENALIMSRSSPVLGGLLKAGLHPAQTEGGPSSSAWHINLALVLMRETINDCTIVRLQARAEIDSFRTSALRRGNASMSSGEAPFSAQMVACGMAYVLVLAVCGEADDSLTAARIIAARNKYVGGKILSAWK